MRLLFRGIAIRAALPALAIGLVTGTASARQQGRPELPGVKIEVVSPLPVPGVDLPKDQIAAPVQVGTTDDIQKAGSLDVSDFLNRRFADVYVNEMQGNPYQPDVNYRGYTASPLLGTPQGLSIYMDGVRLNQPFGDVVSWDLIPQVAISSLTLMPGSNPLFGLNTLGGALSIQTKDGRSNPGGSLEVRYGSHVRRAIEFETGGVYAKNWSWYLAANRLGEEGWRPDSHSDVRQMFGKFGWQGMQSDVSLTLAYANNSLNGNALQENRFLARDYSSIYTRPDNTHNRSAFVNLGGKRFLNAKTLLSGNIYYRDIRTKTFNGDVNEGSLDQQVYQPNGTEQTALTNEGYTGFPTGGADASNTPFPFWRCIANVLLNDEPGEKCNGLINRGQTVQHNFGLSAQSTRLGTYGRNKNEMTFGAAYDRSRVVFRQITQLGFLNPDRTLTGLPAYADGGVTGGDVDGAPFDTRVDLEGVVHTWSLYGTDTFSIHGLWHLTVSGRYNRTIVDNADAIQPGGGPGSLNGHHVFQRFNPAVGLTFNPSNRVNVYFGYSEGSRAATSIESGCADPNQPCKLPNAMLGDPPLEQVVTRTVESGIRSGVKERINWNLSYFFAQNHNDILFVTSTATGFGYFKNFGKTRRQGMEFGANGVVRDKVTIGGGYTFLDATYQSSEEVNGTGNSSNDGGPGLEGAISIEPGDRLPLTPRHMLKIFADYRPIRKLFFGLSFIAVSSSLARGNENGEHEADGVYYVGPGRSPGYGVVNADARFAMHPRWEVVAELNNVFNKRYFTGAQLGTTAFTETGNFIARPFPGVGGEFPLLGATFLAPGAPRMFSVGLHTKF